jgi:hypothetical protein
MAQLTPEQIKALLAEYGKQGNPQDGQFYNEGDNRYYLPLYENGGVSGGDAGDWQPGQRSGYMAFDKRLRDDGTQRAGDYKTSQFTKYDPSGQQTKTGTMDWMGNTNLRDILEAAAVVGGAGLAGGALAGAGAAGGGGAAGAAGGGGYTFGTTGAIGGYGAATGTGAAWAPAVGGAAGGASFGVNMTPAELASGAHVPGSMLPAGSVAPSVMSGAGGAGGAGSAGSGLGGMGGKLLGAGATLLGGASGAAGGAGGDLTRKMDPRMDQYVYGDQGIMNRTQGLLNQQMSPESMAQWQKMQGVGMGLLQQPVAGNAFERFYGGKK